MEENNYLDLALILSWPDATIRGDEKWMMFLKKLGIVKNLNFKVGHTGVVLICRHTGEMSYYDFGRYISPRGYGRARSKNSDPRLSISMKADFDDQGQLSNLVEICHYFETMKPAMQGYGDLYIGLARNISLTEAKKYADRLVEEGSSPYGAVASDNNNCSRFITRLLLKSSKKYHFFHSINFPETIKASPLSNIVNAGKDRMLYSFNPAQGLRYFKMNRWQSIGFLAKKLRDNFYSQQAKELPEDLTIGEMNLRFKPQNIPDHAQYLGGVGEGAWFEINKLAANILQIKRYTPQGELEYCIKGHTLEDLTHCSTLQITYDSHLLYTHLLVDGRKIKVTHLEQSASQSVNNNLPTALYA